MASDMPPVYDYIKSLLSAPPPDKVQCKKKSEVRHFERKTKCAFAYAYDVTAFPESSFIAVLHTDTEYLVCVEFGKEGFKALRQNDEGNYGLMIVVLDGNTVKGISNIGDDFKFTIPEESGKPCRIAVKDSKLIAISFPDKGKISLYDKKGYRKEPLNAPSLRGVFTITSKDRFIYTTPKKIVSISDTGEEKFSSNTSSTPRSICCDNDGNIYVTLKTDETSCGVDCFTKYGAHMGCVVENCGDPYDDITLVLTPSRDLIVAAKKSVKIFKVPLPWGMFKCYKKCVTCEKHVRESPSITSYFPTRTQYPLKSHLTCTTKNIIYRITCKKCEFQFVGQTKQPLKQKIDEHRNKTSFVKHYRQGDHTVNDMMVQGIESFDNSDGLGSRERLWIEKLQTIKYGLNKQLPTATENCIPKQTHPRGMFKCQEQGCIFCEKHVEESLSFTCSRTKENNPILSRITCTTQNVVYLITCKKCNIQYVGQTEQQLKERVKNHRSTVTNTTAIDIHFSGQHSIQDMVVQGIESLDENSESTLTDTKKFWKDRL